MVCGPPGGAAGGGGCGEGPEPGVLWPPGVVKAQGREEGIPACQPLEGPDIFVLLGKNYSRKT